MSKAVSGYLDIVICPQLVFLYSASHLSSIEDQVSQVSFIVKYALHARQTATQRGNFSPLGPTVKK